MFLSWIFYGLVFIREICLSLWLGSIKNYDVPSDDDDDDDDDDDEM